MKYQLVDAKNYETKSKFVKVMPRLWLLFFRTRRILHVCSCSIHTVLRFNNSIENDLIDCKSSLKEFNNDLEPVLVLFLNNICLAL